MPWRGAEPPYGFSESSDTWLPMPSDWASLTVEHEDSDPASMLLLYRRALALRAIHPALGRGRLTWLDAPAGLLAMRIASDTEPVTVVVNTRDEAVALPKALTAHAVLLSSDADLLPGAIVHDIPADTTLWLRQP